MVMRLLNNVDVATGLRPITANDGTLYSSKGPEKVGDMMNEVEDNWKEILQVCYLLDVNGTCTDGQKEMISNGTVEIQNYMIVDSTSTRRFPETVGEGRGWEFGV